MIIENFPLYKQKASNTCGYAAAGMILSFLEGLDIDEDYLMQNDPFDALGITFTKLIEIYKKYLNKHDASLIYGDIDKMTTLIKTSLSSNLPLHILHLTENLMGNKEPALHYAAVIGINETDESFVIADPYGFIKVVSKPEFFSSVSFRNECLPAIIKEKYPSHMMLQFIKKQ